ncbi:hypothetical protein DFH08DRAFT_807227 [Mycena albidolilacea]|uniref:Uncharacterized protein n=1 Tax=Mycena albidolilacea TaxID=1033008 RepID=A0AAD7A5L1_9AGAR|nr:hypothetical protein DFH08DRAFT_807227 [Mycena albidolilacea]
MPRGKPLSEDLRGVILNMGMNHDVDSIAAMTRDYRNKGTVMRQNMYKELRGRKHSLTVSDTNCQQRPLGRLNSRDARRNPEQVEKGVISTQYSVREAGQGGDNAYVKPR